MLVAEALTASRVRPHVYRRTSNTEKVLTMRALKKARKLIEQEPQSQTAQALSALVVALETGTAFDLQCLYQLGFDDFELAMDVLKEWRLDRYYSSKVRLLDVSMQAGEMQQSEGTPKT